MQKEDLPVIRLADYRPTPYAVATVDLSFRLDPEATEVSARIAFEPRQDTAPGTPLSLDGDGLDLTAVRLDGADLAVDAYEATPGLLVLKRPPAGAFTLAIDTRLNPSKNSALMGLYLSSGVFATQCEAEGFRRITYFHDRPDVLAVYTVRIEADKRQAPILLSNGNLVETGELGDGRHFAVWHDPHPKPAYLFALVGGDLGAIRDSYTTASGRTVRLAIHCEHGKEERCRYAMESLKRAMRWDEERFGREYDLDDFNIVAVSDFNMGAMENKGLNIFNDKFVLVDTETGTDADHANVEAVIAHEYFHNWTGNRITCRDWFQLCLKEGLTVFRDQEFSSDMRSRPVKRIADVVALRTNQFPEDSGPLAHAVRPDTYREINNFYTATVYEKGAEICRMLQAVLGATGFRAGMDLYFDRHDGDATTIENFLKCFEDATGADLSHFSRWYAQAGTPVVSVRHRFDADADRLTLSLKQRTPPTPGQKEKKPLHIPLRFGLVGPDGQDLSWSSVTADTGEVDARDGVIHLTNEAAEVTFEGVKAKPVPSLLRGFSAPVSLERDLTADDLLFLVGHDPDPFNRWDAAQNLARDMLTAASRTDANGEPRFDGRLAEALGRLAADDRLDTAFRALALHLPSEADIAQALGSDVDPDRVHAAREALRRTIGAAIGDALLEIADRNSPERPYTPDAENAGRRALQNAALDLALAGGRVSAGEVLAAFQAAENLTDRFAALRLLALGRHAEAAGALDAFYQRYANTPLVIDKWFAVQAITPGHDTLDRVMALQSHPAFSDRTPNRVYALIRTFGANPTGFNRPDGGGYRFLAAFVGGLDPHNPSVAARLATCFRSYRMLEEGRRKRAEAALESLAEKPALSRDVADIVERILSG